MLNLTGMLEPALHDRPEHLGLQKEVSEPTGVDGNIVSLDLPVLSWSSVYKYQILKSIYLD